MIPSQQRATILSFDSLIDNAGGIVAQPALGKSADVWGYPTSYLISAAGIRARPAVHLPGPGGCGHAGRQGDGAAPSHGGDQLSQAGRCVTPTAPARATSSHRVGGQQHLSCRTDPAKRPAGTSRDRRSSWRSSPVPDHPAFG